MHVRSTDYRSTRRDRQRCSSSSPVVPPTFPHSKLKSIEGDRLFLTQKRKNFRIQSLEFREMLFQVGGQGTRPTFFEMAAAQQLPSSLRAALTYSIGVNIILPPPHPSPLILLFLLGFCLVPLYTYSMIIRIWNHNLIFVLRRDAARLLAGVGFKKALPP